MMSTIVECVAEHAARSPDRLALVSDRTTLSYRQLLAEIVAAADWLRSERVEPGARVLIPSSQGDPGFAVPYLAAHLVGAIAVPIDSRLPPSARRAIESFAMPSLVLFDETQAHLRKVIAGAAEVRELPRYVRIDEETIADLLFTSGSTGQPKGVALTHRNVMAATRNIVAYIGNGPSDREVVTVPLSHSFGLGRMRCAFQVGGTLVLSPGLSFPALVFRHLEQHAATGLACVPAGVSILLSQGEELLGRFSQSLRYMEIGSAPMAIEVKRTLARILPRTRICMHYGLTEASRSAFLELHNDVEHLDSVGRATPGVQIRIADVEGVAAARGQVGSIQIKADTVMSHYWNDAERTRHAFTPDGWLQTGDLGRLDEEGYLYLAGRSDDLINVGGKKVDPLAIEAVANSFPGVAESACAATPDPEQILGEVPALWLIELAPGAVDVDELLGLMRRELEAHAVPRKVHKVVNLPKTESGKLQRAKLRARSD